MNDTAGTGRDKIRERRAKLDMNVFSRLTSIHSSSRGQGQRLLQMGGGLSIVEWRTLWDLNEIGPMSVRELAYVQRSDHSLLSRALPKMRRKGYITTTRDQSDGRQTIVEITQKGQELFNEAAPLMQRRRDALREHFSATEIADFIAFIDRLEDFLALPVDAILEEEISA